MNRNFENFEPSCWLDEDDWLCTTEFLPTDDAEFRGYAADAIGYMFGCAHLTDTRMVALIADPEAEAYELLFSFASPEGRAQFFDLLRRNEAVFDSSSSDQFIGPSSEEIKLARPLAMVLPEDAPRPCPRLPSHAVIGGMMQMKVAF
jgi:hypothetical protein